MRSLLAGLAGLVACLLLPLGVVSTWLAEVVSDTPTYVDTVSPLAEDEAVQDAVGDRLETELRERLPGGVGASLARPAVDRVVEGPEFPPLWRAANRAAHRQLVAILEQDSRGDVTLRLDPLAEAVVDGLAGSTLPAGAVDVPPVGVTIAESQELQRARTGYRLLEAAGFWLPLLWLGAVAVTLLVARRRLATAARLALVSAAALLAGWLVIGLVRAGVVGSVPADDRALAEAVWDGVTASLSAGLLGLAGLSLVAALGLGLLARVTRRRTA